MQVVMSLLEVHWLLQLPLQVASQLPEQLKLPMLAVQAVMQEPEQLSVHVPLIEPVHMAEALTVQFRGVQLAVHPPEVSTLHERPVAPEKSMPPHAAIGMACAVRGTRATKALTAAATTAVAKR
jgi:hypothetical protein